MAQAPSSERRDRPDVIVIMTDEERAAPPYESDELGEWRRSSLANEQWFAEHATKFVRHYTGSLACVPSRPTLFTGQYPDVHGVTQTDGLGKLANDSRLRWLPEGEVPTLGHWFRAAGYDTHYDGKWHISHADIMDSETGGPLRTNDEHGAVDDKAVAAYLQADPLNPYGFSGWVGPEPHGAPLANSGVRRDPLIAARVVAWLQDRYERREANDADALKPFLLVASFVNPHDIVLWPLWALSEVPAETQQVPTPPSILPPPTADEDLANKPTAQAIYRQSYPTAYGPESVIAPLYKERDAEYRELYYRLHALVDGPLEQVRKAVTDGGSANAVIVRTSDHGDLLGAHGGLHQKWYNLYDEATRVPFSIARVTNGRPSKPNIVDAPSSHVDLVPTLLGAAGIDENATALVLANDFTEVHPLPGRDLMSIVDEDVVADSGRAVYLMTRDAMLEGDSGASGAARRMGMADDPPPELQIQLPIDLLSNFEGVVGRVSDSEDLWKLVRCFDDPATWSEPGVRHRGANGCRADGLAVKDNEAYRTEPLADQWELYNLTLDPTEAHNVASHLSGGTAPQSLAGSVFASMKDLLVTERERCLAERNAPWPYALSLR